MSPGRCWMAQKSEGLLLLVVDGNRKAARRERVELWRMHQPNNYHSQKRGCLSHPLQMNWTD